MTDTAHKRPLRPPTGAAGDLAELFNWLTGVTDEHRMGQARRMLKSERYQLHVELTPDDLLGVVGSPRSDENLHSTHIHSDGHFCCVNQHLELCAGMQGLPCAHLMVLMLGMAQAQRLPVSTVRSWVGQALQLPTRTRVRVDSNRLAGGFVQYRGGRAGQLDWRPVETIPEDYYAL